MNNQLTNLIYHKYEKYSLRYIISTQQVTDFIELILEDSPNLNYDEVSYELDKLISEKYRSVSGQELTVYLW